MNVHVMLHRKEIVITIGGIHGTLLRCHLLKKTNQFALTVITII